MPKKSLNLVGKFEETEMESMGIVISKNFIELGFQVVAKVYITFYEPMTVTVLQEHGKRPLQKMTRG